MINAYRHAGCVVTSEASRAVNFESQSAEQDGKGQLATPTEQATDKLSKHAAKSEPSSVKLTEAVRQPERVVQSRAARTYTHNSTCPDALNLSALRLEPSRASSIANGKRRERDTSASEIALAVKRLREGQGPSGDVEKVRAYRKK